MARTFDGVDDKIDFGKTVHANYSDVNTPVNVVSSTQSHPEPFRLANGDIILAYSTNEDGGDHEISCKISSDDGSTWGSRIEIETDAAATNAYEASFCQLTGGTIFAFIGDGSDLQYRTSTNNGATWSSETVITASATNVHPSGVKIESGSNAEDMVVVYNRAGDIYCKYSTDDGSTWSSEVTIVSDANTKIDPHVALLPSGDLICTYPVGTSSSSTIEYSKSTDDGRTWGAKATLFNDFVDTTSYYPDPYVLVCDGYCLCFYADGNDGSHTAYALVFDQEMNRFKYRIPVNTTTSDDPHRIRGVLSDNSVPLIFHASYDGGADYGVQQLKQGRRFQPPSDINDLEVFTSWAWIKYHGTPNAGEGMYILSKDGVDKVQLYIQDNGSTVLNQLRCYVNYSTGSTAYNSSDNAISDNTWTFVCTVFDASLSTPDRIKMYAGTSPANFAEVSYSQQTDGSGTVNSDAAGNMVVGTRTSDNNRVFDGEIGAVGYTKELLNYDIEILKSLMVSEFPSEVGITPAFFTKTEGFKAPVDFITGRTGTVTGATDAGEDYPFTRIYNGYSYIAPVVGGATGKSNPLMGCFGGPLSGAIT